VFSFVVASGICSLSSSKNHYSYSDNHQKLEEQKAI
jgi:hypothetical protein